MEIIIFNSYRMIENEKQKLKKSDTSSLLNRKRIHFCDNTKNISFNPKQYNLDSAKSSKHQQEDTDTKIDAKIKLNSENNYSDMRKQLIQGYKIIAIEKSSLNVLEVGKAQIINFVYKKRNKSLLLSSLNFSISGKGKLLYVFSRNFSSSFLVMLNSLKENGKRIKNVAEAIQKDNNNNNQIYFAKRINYSLKNKHVLESSNILLNSKTLETSKNRPSSRTLFKLSIKNKKLTSKF